MESPTDVESTSGGEERKGRALERRASRSERRRAEPTAKELAMAARELKHHLNWIVSVIDEHAAAGKTEAEGWEAIRLRKANTEEGGIPRRGDLQSHSAIEAIRLYAKKSTLDDRRGLRAIALSTIAKDFLNGELDAKDSWRLAAFAREDDALNESETIASLNAAIASTRTTTRRWQEVYNTLAWNADVYPLPDTKRGLRGDMKRLFEMEFPMRPSLEDLYE